MLNSRSAILNAMTFSYSSMSSNWPLFFCHICRGPFLDVWTFVFFSLQSQCVDFHLCNVLIFQNFISRWYIRHLWPARSRSSISRSAISRRAVIGNCLQGRLPHILKLARRCVDVDQALHMCDLAAAGRVQFQKQIKTKHVWWQYQWGVIHLWYVSMHGNCIWKGKTFRIRNIYKILITDAHPRIHCRPMEPKRFIAQAVDAPTVGILHAHLLVLLPKHKVRMPISEQVRGNHQKPCDDISQLLYWTSICC